MCHFREVKVIENRLPHSGEMILVDSVISVDKQSIKTKSVITPSPFIQNGKFATFNLLEIMAQSLGLYKSYIYDSGSSVGFVVGSRKFEIFKPFLNIDDEVICEAVLSTQDESGFGVYECSCEVSGEVVAKARLSVFSPSIEKLEELKNMVIKDI